MPQRLGWENQVNGLFVPKLQETEAISFQQGDEPEQMIEAERELGPEILSDERAKKTSYRHGFEDALDMVLGHGDEWMEAYDKAIKLGYFSAND